ncbi:type II toxin-antitoxin system prevent-host-death family antitoxin [Nocardia sp. NPDC019395]|uniref:type II toxin-antitoxin system Phd/YefM family antitoxin n=1 Tax=Nocardia sp. NPDC019395 TaxID=3154686 RepID=UPI0034030ECB
MTALHDSDAWELPVSEARDKLAEVVAAAESGKVVHLTRHGHRVAAVVPQAMAETADRQVRELSRRFASDHPALLDKLAE